MARGTITGKSLTRRAISSDRWEEQHATEAASPRRKLTSSLRQPRCLHSALATDHGFPPRVSLHFRTPNSTRHRNRRRSLTLFISIQRGAIFKLGKPMIPSWSSIHFSISHLRSIYCVVFLFCVLYLCCVCCALFVLRVVRRK